MTNRAFGSQRGVVLVVGLIFLLLMTVIGITSIQTTTLDERMAGNANDRNIAFQAAEAGLRRAEALIMGATNKYDFQSQFVRSATPTPDADSAWTINSTDHIYSYDDFEATIGTATDLGVPAPAYVIQCLDSICASGFYRVTSRAQGIAATSVVILETIISSGHGGSVAD